MLIAAAAVVSGACGDGEPTSGSTTSVPTTSTSTASSADPSATWALGPCPDIPSIADVLATATCGTLSVPEDRTDPQTQTIDLPVVIVPAKASTPQPDPLVYMVGGPGGSALPLAKALVDDLDLNRDRDLIIMAQRGTSFTDPELTCPGFDAFRLQSVDLAYDAPATGQAHVTEMTECRDNFIAEGADLGAYNTTQNAADFSDLRTALGIEEWNVYGVSYGTYLALSYMHLFPDGIRSVTVDSVLTPDDTTLGSFWRNAAVGLGNIFTACENDERCNSRYPDVRQTFEDLVVQLEEEPIVATVKPAALPGTPPAPDAVDMTVNVDGGAFANWAAGMSEPAGSRLPAMITAIANGDTDPLAASWGALAATHSGVYSYGLQNGVICSEWVPYAEPDDPVSIGREVFPAFPESVLRHAPQFPFMQEDCELWDVPAGDPSQRTIGGDAPVLFIAGSYDALTSPYYAKRAVEQLPNATMITIPGVGHFVLPKSQCAQEVMHSFLADPTAPDTSCVSDLDVPAFE